MNYIIYARKSTDSEERQVLSIDAQLAELREFARKEHLHVLRELVESQTAKEPGRPVTGGSPRQAGAPWCRSRRRRNRLLCISNRIPTRGTVTARRAVKSCGLPDSPTCPAIVRSTTAEASAKAVGHIGSAPSFRLRFAPP